MAFIYQSNNHSGRYSAFKIQYGRFRYFRHFSWMIIIFCGNFWIFVLKTILHVQIGQFGGSNLQKHEILTPVTPKNHEKIQNFRYRNFKAKFDPVPTHISPLFFFIFWQHEELIDINLCRQIVTSRRFLRDSFSKLEFRNYQLRIWT